MNVLVTGGTGQLGRHVVTFLRQSGHRARILSRTPRGHVDAVQGDLATGAGLDRAVAGMDAIVHAASATGARLNGRAVDVDGTRRLLERARDERISHVVLISIVGIDHVRYPYYRTKLAAEAVVREEIVPWSILRATQFHGFIDFVLAGFSRVPGVTAVPFGWKFQPVDVVEVAQRITAVVLDSPCGMLPDFGGPEVREMHSLARAWLDARKSRRRLVNLPMPVRASKNVSEGALTCPDQAQGVMTFDQYLEERYPAA